MERIKYDPKEFQMEFMETRFGPSPVFHTPITPRANWRAMFDGKNPLWMPMTSESQTFCPRCDPDNIARAFVFDGEEPYDRSKYGGPDMFGIEWVFVPVVGGSMENPDNPHPLEDANDWRDVINFPDVNSWDWEASAKGNAKWFETNKNYVQTITFLNGTGFERLVSFMGFENAAMAMTTSPSGIPPSTRSPCMTTGAPSALPSSPWPLPARCSCPSTSASPTT